MNNVRTNETAAYEAIRRAQVRIDRPTVAAPMTSSAQACVSDALSLYNEGRFSEARAWALRSLSYTVGVFHPDYRTA